MRTRWCEQSRCKAESSWLSCTDLYRVLSTLSVVVLYCKLKNSYVSCVYVPGTHGFARAYKLLHVSFLLRLNAYVCAAGRLC